MIGYIVAPGPSLQYLTKEFFKEDGIVIAVNEALNPVERLGLEQRVYGIENDVVPQEKSPLFKETPLLVSEEGSSWHPEHTNKIPYSRAELTGWSNAFTGLCAMHWAVKRGGASRLVMLCFDSCTIGETGYASCTGVEWKESYGTGIFDRCKIMKKAPFDMEWVTPSRKFTVITPTRNRPKQLRNLASYISRQSALPDQWVVVDDGESPTALGELPYLEYIKAPESHSHTNTIQENLKKAFEKVRNDVVMIMEDDDWYHPDFCRTLLKELEENELVGIAETFQYHVGERRMHHVRPRPYPRSCLCTIGVRGEALKCLKDICWSDKSRFILDRPLWDTFSGKKATFKPQTILHVGFKGNPEFAGHTRPHRDPSLFELDDHNLTWLDSAIGADVDRYFNRRVSVLPFISTGDRPRVLSNFDFPENLYRNASIFLVMSGPSLQQVADKLNSSPVMKFGVNNSPSVVRPNLWTCADEPSRFIKSIWTDPQIIKFVPEPHRNHPIWDSVTENQAGFRVCDSPGVVFYPRKLGLSPLSFFTESSVCWGHNGNYRFDNEEVGGARSVCLEAFRLSVALGFRRIFFVGADFNMRPEEPYAFEEEKSPGGCNSNNNTYRFLDLAFKSLIPQMEKYNIQAFNCTENSGLTAFPYLPFSVALESAVSEAGPIFAEPTYGMYRPLKSKLKETDMGCCGKKSRTVAPYISSPKAVQPTKPLAEFLTGVHLYEKRGEILALDPSFEKIFATIARKEELFAKTPNCKGCSLEKGAIPALVKFAELLEKNPNAGKLFEGKWFSTARGAVRL